jgi:hypothetical protein
VIHRPRGWVIGASLVALGLALSATWDRGQNAPVPDAPAAVGILRPSGLASAESPIAATPSAGSSSAGSSSPPTYVAVLDFLAYAEEAVAVDPIAGSPDAAELIPVIGDPTRFGATIIGQAVPDDNASSRCGLLERSKIELLARTLNGRLPADQQIDPAASESRSLLHWAAAEGFASVRIFAQRATGSPSCGDAGGRF